MTSRDRIRAAACEGCAKGLLVEINGHHLKPCSHVNGPVTNWWTEVSPCTAPSDIAIIEQQAGEIERLNIEVAGSRLHVCTPVFDQSRIATALGLPADAGVEEIVERAKLFTESGARGFSCGFDAVRRQG